MISDVSTRNTEALGMLVRFCRPHDWSEDEIAEAIGHCIGYGGVRLVRKALIVARDVCAQMEANRELPPA